MAKLIIDGIEYVPKWDIQALTDERCKKCLEALAKMLRIGRDNNMHALTYSAIYALSPELAEIEDEEAYRIIRGERDDAHLFTVGWSKDLYGN